MQSRTPRPEPDPLAAHRDAVDVTHATHFDPQSSATHWAMLKQARGQTVDFSRLSPHFLVDLPPVAPPAPTDNAVDRARAAALPRIRDAVAARLGRSLATDGAA